MNFKSIYDYFDDNFSYIEEGNETIKFNISGTNYYVIFIPVVGKASSKLQNWIIGSINQMMVDDLSHMVAGTYTIDNMKRFPDNIFILFCRNSKIEVLLNVKENESILIHSYLFSSVSDPVEFNLMLTKIVKFLNSLKEIFVIASGQDLTEFLLKNLEFDRTSIQTVYNLQEFELYTFEDNPEDELIIFDGKHNNLRLNILKDAYNYTYSDKQLKGDMKNYPHVVIIKKDSNEIMATARINANTGSVAVIGGVLTAKKFRQMGLGFKVSYVLTNFIRQRIRSVVLDTDTKNFPAIRIYEKIGFRPVGKSIFIEKGRTVIRAIYGDREY